MNRDLIKSLIKPHEGLRTVIYYDTKAVPTIGWGCNLLTSREDIEAIGADYRLVMAGEPLTLDQCDELLDIQVSRAIKDAMAIFPDFDDLPDEVQAVIVDLVFNLGKSGISKFHHFIAAVERRDWIRASNELVDSKWYHDVNPNGFGVSHVGNRATDDIRLLRSLV